MSSVCWPSARRLAYGGHVLSFSQLGTPARGGALRILTPLADHH